MSQASVERIDRRARNRPKALGWLRACVLNQATERYLTVATDGQDTRAIQHYLGHKSSQHAVC